MGSELRLIFSLEAHGCQGPSGWTHIVVLKLLPLSYGWTLEMADDFASSEAVDGIRCYDHLALPHGQTLQDCTLSVKAQLVLGHLWVMAQPCSCCSLTAPAKNEFMPCEKSLSRNSNQTI